MSSLSKTASLQVTDPVCGMAIRPEDAAGQATYQGQTCSCCSESCREPFQREPEKFLTPRPAPTTNTEWTCPMHPEIVRDARGSCPICGMAL